MFAELFYEKKEDVVVPIEIFQKSISLKIGITDEELQKMDLGEIESKLNIVPNRPNELKSIKRGKSRNTLYRFIPNEDRVKSREMVTEQIR